MPGSDPTRRDPGAWPRARPIRWRGVARNLTWFVAATGCLLLQLGLVAFVLALGSTPWGPVLALVWGAATVATAWAWVVGRRWTVVPPLVTIAACLVVAAIAG